MTSRLKDLDGGREVSLDARSQPGRVYLTGRGFTYEFDRALFMRFVERELDVLVFPIENLAPPEGVALPK